MNPSPLLASSPAPASVPVPTSTSPSTIPSSTTNIAVNFYNEEVSEPVLTRVSSSNGYTVAHGHLGPTEVLSLRSTAAVMTALKDVMDCNERLKARYQNLIPLRGGLNAHTENIYVSAHKHSDNSYTICDGSRPTALKLAFDADDAMVAALQSRHQFLEKQEAKETSSYKLLEVGESECGCLSAILSIFGV